MAETNGTLAVEALLYASGGLEADSAAKFERRLADDQRARDALCRAVEFLGDCAGEAPRPDPAYRERVRAALVPRGGWLRWLVRPRYSRGHPALWGSLGAVAALVMFAVLGPGASPQAALAPVAQNAAALDFGEEDEETVARQARIWADMPRSEHLSKTCEEEARRKARTGTLLRLVKMDDSRSRLVAPATIKN